MIYVGRLEQFWREFAPSGTDLGNAFLVYNPDLPLWLFNYVTCVNVSENEVKSLLNRAIEYYSSRDIPNFCFRISPLTHPKSFTSFLEDQGFERKIDQSVMVLKEKKYIT